MTNEELLKVLDMSEDEQLFFLNNLWQNRKLPEWFNLQPNIDGKLVMSDNNRRLLADLAFRLRDEVFKEYGAIEGFHEGIYKVMMKVEGHDNWATAYWGECIANPIHWIIAALIAKGSK